jgi:hypothetical protein
VMPAGISKSCAADWASMSTMLARAGHGQTR